MKLCSQGNTTIWRLISFPTDMHQISCYFHRAASLLLLLGHRLATGHTQDDPPITPLDVKVAAGILMEVVDGNIPGAASIQHLAKWVQKVLLCQALALQLESLFKLVPTGQQFCTLVLRHALICLLKLDLGQLRSRGEDFILPSLVAWTSLNVMAPDTGPRSRKATGPGWSWKAGWGQRAWAAQVGLRLSVGSSRLPSRNAGPGKTRR